MPEGDTVWLSAKRMHDAFAGEALTRSDFRIPSLATVDLAGLTVVSVRARGKHMLTELSDGRFLHTHFRMDGTWHLYRPGDRWQGGPDWQVRVVLENAEWQAVGYRLPVVRRTGDAGAVRAGSTAAAAGGRDMPPDTAVGKGELWRGVPAAMRS